MAIYNTAVTVVDLIEADSPEDAMRILRQRVIAQGFDILDGSADAFESEDLV